ncbi:TriG protein [Yersinia aldovae]|uniref:virB8 family protein n=1 Tax=Yersinia aldovae TaxID=29483 RepID=UPI0005E09A92|nr:type IV secretion system protein [Yersinia aldovae]CNK25698.1 TriG protein [Yersinia aldovae]
MFKRKKDNKQLFSSDSAKEIFDENTSDAELENSSKFKKESDAESNKFFKEVTNFQADRAELKNKQLKVAGWLVVILSLLIVALGGAITAMLPLKEVKPYVIRVDNNTGFADVATPISDGKTTYGQELDKYWLAKYVINRESYEWNTIQNMYDTVELMSNNKVFSEYKTIIESKTTSPLHILKQDKKMNTRVISVAFIDDVAQVRFIKYVTNSDGKKAEQYATTSWIATLTYDYKHKITKEVQRMVNPLGFQATSYRVDPENVEVKQ